MRGKTLIHEELVPKARDSYTFLHLMDRIRDRPLILIFLLGLETTEPALLGPFKDKLLQRLRKEADRPWLIKYVTDCVVLTPSSWPDKFPQYPLRVLPSSTPEPPLHCR
jgi:hypothetical protein